MITIKEVAESAGVCITTVSRVMNNRGVISEKTRKKVLQTMKELNYHPNEMARSLLTKKTHIIGLIVPTVEHPYFCKVVDAVEARCSALNYKLLLCTSDHSSEKEFNMSAMLRANKVDGVLIYSQVDDPKIYVDYGLPVVALDNAMPGIPAVLCDNYQGGAYAARTLIESGSVHPVIFGFEDMKNQIGLQRIAGYRDECVSKKIEYREYLVEKSVTFNEDMLDEDFMEHFNGLLNRYPDTDGIFVTNEIIAIMALQKAKEMGRQIPKDLQIIGYDGTYLSKLMNLSTVAQPIEQLCSYALDMLFKRMDGSIVPSSSILPVMVIKRRSTRTV